MSQEDCRVLLARGFLLGTSGGNTAPPGNGATITIYDSTLTGQATGTMTANIDLVKFNRVQLNVYSSHDSGASGVVFSSSFDRGTNFRTQASYTYTNASGPTTYDYLMKGSHFKVAYTNSANVLTAWEMELIAIYDRNPGV